jgi:hypothetical protein
MLIHSHQSGNNARAANNPRPEFKPCMEIASERVWVNLFILQSPNKAGAHTHDLASTIAVVLTTPIILKTSHLK